MSRQLFSPFVSLALLSSCLLPDSVLARDVTLFPEQQLYPVNLADPRRIQFSAKSLYFEQTTIDQTGERRFDLKLGGRLGLLHWPDVSGQDNRGWLLSIDAGFHGQFDVDASQDNIGWDGIYALMLSYRPNRSLAFKIGAYHISSHVGDEYMERTGRARINYTREELQAGVNLALDDRWQWYVEAGRAYDRRNNRLQKPWRAQTGLQYQPGNDRETDWYAGLDIGASEERDWQKDLSLQVGWQIPTPTRVWRIGIEAYDGKAQLGEFFQDNERYIGVGLWLDI
ncbi:DUF1207 domain-containing protein [Thiohalophilus sp.]|uniref:DUF1207 domain-containing protein n=1 Tax=Thiohalophilus sp. TaxID=3028392 RepID=UPI002ACE315A|nr:DUF1207 domain-containing protein [Thiohalophilus sp.]MDZ7805221.1 DUF1207 domain-containing protein [Thiohalophilus sp.]